MASDMKVSPVETGGGAVAALAATLAQGRSDAAGALFAAHGAPAPMIVWRPTLVDAGHPILRSFLRGCGDSGGPLPVTWLDSEEFAALADWTMIVAPVAGSGDDYVYRHYGAKIAEVYQADLTGQHTSSIGGHVALFFTALYNATSRRREPVLSVHEPPRQVFVRAWRRLIQPLTDGDGTIVCHAVANVPDNDLRAGLEVLPHAVMVVAAGGDVCYANRAACLLFGQPRSPLAGMGLGTFTGLDVRLPESPDRLILEGHPAEERMLLARGGILVPVRLTIGATFYRDLPLYVISAREDS
jgi:PAS domain-containing protein